MKGTTASSTAGSGTGTGTGTATGTGTGHKPLREVRNAGAHFDPAKNITRQYAEDSITFNEALLDYLD